MFCPRCGTENGFEQSYCRQCGLSLPAVGLALQGRVDEAMVKLRRGSGSLSGGAIVFVIALINALVNGYFAAWQSALFSALLGSAIGVPLMVSGMARVSQARRLLNPGEAAKGLSEAPGGASSLPPETPDATLNPGPAAADSVTEHTTLRLDSSKSAGRK